MTETEIEEFWKSCGLVRVDNPISPEVSNTCEAMTFDRPINGWYEPDYQKGTSKLITMKRNPVIDLNNLFKWAVPKAIEIIMRELGFDWWHAYQVMLERWHWNIVDKNTDTAQALLRAIQQVRER